MDSQTGLRSWRVRVEFEQSVPLSLSSDNVSSFDDNHNCYDYDNGSFLLSSDSVPSASGRMRKERTKEKPRPRALNI